MAARSTRPARRARTARWARTARRRARSVAIIATSATLLAACSAGGLPGLPTGAVSAGSTAAGGPHGSASEAASGAAAPASAGTAGGSGGFGDGTAGAGSGPVVAGHGSDGGASAAGSIGDEASGAGASLAGPSGSSIADAGASGSGNGAGTASSGASSRAAAPVTVPVDRSVTFAGWTVTVKSLTWKPPAYTGLPPTVTLDVLFDNPADFNALFGVDSVSDDWLTLSCGDHHYSTAGNIDFPQVPGQSRGEGTATFTVDDAFDPDTAVLTIGTAALVQSVLPLGSAGTLVNPTPQELELTGSLTSGPLTVHITGGQLRSDLPKALTQAPSDKRYLLLNFDVTNHSHRPAGYGDKVIGSSPFTLLQPNGNTINAADANAYGWYASSAVATVKQGTTFHDLVVLFVVASPAEGPYQVQFRYRNDRGTDLAEQDTWEFTVPPAS